MTNIKIEEDSLEYITIQMMIESRPDYLELIGAKESALSSMAMRNLKKMFNIKNKS